ncbi:11280_t:CDS:2 [Dentiscutata heterogama]|uniref:11280_t:CDS:1 n=1 Tax=Dentiscutata heterogama TaxID=1316150 RepID=A0ACA9MBU1_9GLOM|nr:11280_t:CDS:2 [Dentiscutata heterogama]
MEGYVSVKYENPGPRPNEIKIFHLDEEGKSYEPLELVEPNKPKEFKIYKQEGQYFKIGDSETDLEEIKNNQGTIDSLSICGCKIWLQKILIQISCKKCDLLSAKNNSQS